MPDYKNGKIYQVVCNITGETYVGSTVRSLEDRLMEHEKPTNPCCSKQIIERSDYYIELLETYPCESKCQLDRKEGEYQLSTTKCINKVIAGRTEAEWGKEYRKNNKEYLVNKGKLYYQDNIEMIKQKRIIKITCKCGMKISTPNIAKHRRSKNHIDLMNKITSPSNDLLGEEKVL